MSKNGTRHNPYKGLKRTLRAKGLRYEDVAELLDRSVPAVCKKMNGESDFYLYELHKMCSSYGLDLAAFI